MDVNDLPRTGIHSEVAKPLSSGLALFLASIANSTAQKTYLEAARDKLTGSGFKDWGIRKLIQARALANGYIPHNVDKPEHSAIMNFKKPKSIGPFELKGVLASSKDTGPGVMAHEMGHILQNTHLPTYSLSQQAPSLGTLGVALLPGRRAKLTSAIAGAVGGLPTLGYEVDASRRGSNILESLGYDSPGTAYVGVPTYALNVGMPLGAYGIRQAVLKALTKGRA